MRFISESRRGSALVAAGVVFEHRRRAFLMNSPARVSATSGERAEEQLGIEPAIEYQHHHPVVQGGDAPGLHRQHRILVHRGRFRCGGIVRRHRFDDAAPSGGGGRPPRASAGPRSESRPMSAGRRHEPSSKTSLDELPFVAPGSCRRAHGGVPVGSNENHNPADRSTPFSGLRLVSSGRAPSGRRPIFHDTASAQGHPARQKPRETKEIRALPRPSIRLISSRYMWFLCNTRRQKLSGCRKCGLFASLSDPFKHTPAIESSTGGNHDFDTEDVTGYRSGDNRRDGRGKHGSNGG